MKALRDEATEAGLMTVVHVPQMNDAEEVSKSRDIQTNTISGQAFVIPVEGHLTYAHGIIDKPLSDSFVARCSKSKAHYVPTFCVFQFLADVKGFMNNALVDDRFRSALPVDQLKRYTSEEYYDHYRKAYPNISFVKSHLKILERNMIRVFHSAANVAMGTDMWAFPGVGIHLEFEYMTKAGISEMEAIVCATRNGTKFLQEPNIGTLEPDKQADLLILDANPLDDIRNTRSVPHDHQAWSHLRPSAID